MRSLRTASRLLLLLALTTAASAAPAPPPVDFTRQIQPILSRHCLACHGMDEKARKGDLRLDLRDAVLAAEAFVPGNPDHSQLVTRIHSADPDEVMPPPDKGEPLSGKEKDLLTRWIAEGAPYAPHWAWQSLQPVAVPALPPPPAAAGTGKKRTAAGKSAGKSAPDPWAAWRHSPVDAFTGAMLGEKGLTPAPEASREEWLRRVTYDLTGLPPTVVELDAFLTDKSPDAWATVADRLLASVACAEHQAVPWLDAARYADTYGRHEDEDCTTWPWRDWVIRAFRENLPYDQFILWQTAGDLLPSPTRDMLIATCFNRLGQQSNEAGSNPEEFRIEQVADRVHTNATAFMGLTAECARCHDHKYDPLTQKDYYQLSALFNNIDELGLFTVYTGAAPPPVLRLYDDAAEAAVTAAREKVRTVTARRAGVEAEARTRFAAWLKSSPPGADRKFALHPVSHLPLDEYKNQQTPDAAAPDKPALSKTKLLPEPGKIGQAMRAEKENVLSIPSIPEVSRADPFTMGIWIKPDGPSRRALIMHRSRSGLDAASRGLEVILADDHLEFALCWFSPGDEARIRTKEPVRPGEWTHVCATHDGSGRTDGMRLYVNGKPAAVDVIRDCLEGEIIYRDEWGDTSGKDAVDVAFALMGRHNDAVFTGALDDFQFFSEELSAAEIRQFALTDSKPDAEELFAFYCRTVDTPCRAWREELHAAREEEAALPAKATELMVMKEWAGPRRATHILTKGQFDAPTAAVEPGTPGFLPPLPADAPRNRLGYARWLTSREHPLTSRVAVNRIWQSLFGRGLVATPEDFGTQGALPSHTELLDWLALHFMDTGWDTRALLRELVLSATYRQAARPRPGTESDPDNEWFSRGPRRRLTAEQMRDTVLAVSGLLDRTVGGPSVKPYQPAGLWEDGGTQHDYVQDHGAGLYRRSLYTFWRRTMPPPSMLAFDSPTREFCRVRRQPTATPAQALVLMNDPQFLEAARVLAETLVRRHPDNPQARAADLWRQLTSRTISDKQQAALLAAYTPARARYQQDAAAATALLTGTGEHPADASLPPAEVAATTLLVRLILSTLEATSNS